jgi:hypothetical protein
MLQQTRGHWTNYKYAAAAAASRISQRNGNITFDRKAAGTADATFTWDNSLIIDYTGNVGIGISPQSFAKLQVKTATDRNVSIFDNAVGTTIGGLTDAGASASLRLAGSPLIMTGGGGAGAEHMRINSDGSVVINNTGGDAQLYLGGTSGTSRMYLARTGLDSILWNVSNGNLRFGTNNSEAMRIDSSGNVGIGRVPDSNAVLCLNVPTGVNTNISFAENGTNKWLIGNTTGSDALRFYDFTSAAERMRIDNGGNLLVGDTSVASGSNSTCTISSGGTISTSRAATNTQSHHVFYNPNGNVGTITTNGTSTAYNTSSDYRLKENVTATWDATTRLKQLNPVRFNFIADPDTTVDGFLAHEVQDVVPEAITGTHNGMRDEEYEVTPAVLDDDGNEVTPAVMGTRSVPDYQGIDQSKLVPLLVKTIQELEARITALETA